MADNGGSSALSTELELTPPETLISTQSAILTNLEVRSEATVSGMLKSYQAEIQENFKVFGETTLSNTLIAGDLTIDGTLQISNGSEINALPILYFQNSPLATKVDFFNSQVVIDQNGNLTAQTISASEYQGVAGKSVGSGKILSGTKSSAILTPLVKPNSRILVTATTETGQVLSVTEKVEGLGFTVSIPSLTSQDIPFDWFIINEALTK